LLVALAAGLALALALPSGAGATVTSTSVSNGDLDVMGSDGADQITIRFKPDAKGAPIVQMYDPQGIPDPLPAGCTRKDEFTVICPASAYLGVDVHTGNGDDIVVWDFGFFLPFSAPRATFLGTSYGIFGDVGAGNDSQSMIGTLPTTQIGGPGNDTLTGGSGPDSLGGGPGNDKLKGNAGPDLLNCGGGTDKGVGGPGNDKSKGCEKGKA
jgi:Ca2+-binding RTX toxin-like protein